MIINKEGFGEAYEKTPVVFIMENGFEIYLYERIREVTNEEIQKVKNEIFG